MSECVSRSNVEIFSASVQLEEPAQTGLETVNLDSDPGKCLSQNWRENNLIQAFVESVPFNDIKQKVIFCVNIQTCSALLCSALLCSASHKKPLNCREELIS
jgi:hypothetical protein